MTTMTDFQMIRQLCAEYAPKVRGLLSEQEEQTIRRVLELDTRTEIELQNVRDMVVMFYGERASAARAAGDYAAFDKWEDAMSAITCAIDSVKFSRGMEV